MIDVGHEYQVLREVARKPNALPSLHTLPNCSLRDVLFKHDRYTQSCPCDTNIFEQVPNQIKGHHVPR